MYDFLLSEEEKALKAEARRFAKEDVPSSLIRDMDGEKFDTPRNFFRKQPHEDLLGLRFATQVGRPGSQVDRGSGGPGRDRRARLQPFLPLFACEYRGRSDSPFRYG